MVENEQNESSDDIQYSEPEVAETDDLELEDIEKVSKNKIKKLQVKLKTCEAEKASYLEDLQRAKADFLNTRRRLDEQQIIERDRTLSTFIESLLPLCDSFDMAFANEELWNSVDDSWRQGVEAIKFQLDGVLKKHNVESYNPTGEVFNPVRHEALSTRDEQLKTDIVLETLQKGYERNGVVIRPAKVIIQN